ncbi:hypothetical protein KBK19_10055 [Microvirga sp. STR05]|uniref:Uncharacterized protein n=1 Tax=Hymenobacter duratus TaxID=2771356 RepID=A0ABR8JI26_9BACT|nr:hypothetical protein [Hymenobacter duratus]MBD2715378.1 hypothetical protein [Hymenobacter duratus]MBR7950285.1 hypothetical protein [Microvirga sp. STR05]
MRNLLSILSLAALVSLGSCAQDRVTQSANPRGYGTVKVKPEKRKNNKARFYKERNPIDLGIDLSPRKPTQYETVKAPKKYKYSKVGW